MSSVAGFVSRNYKSFNPPTPPKEPNALRFGILGAAQNIAPLAMVNPARSHPEVTIEAIATRDLKRAQTFAKSKGIPRAFGSYQELLDDPKIDAVYIPLPHGLHYEWTMKALKAGKHVMVEKPIANTAADARKIFALAKEKNLVVLEAYHQLFHPVMRKMKELVDSGVVGKLKGIETVFYLPSGLIPKDASLRGLEFGSGAMMGVGGYPISVVRYLLGSSPTDMEHISVKTWPENPAIDASAHPVYSFPTSNSSATTIPVSMDVNPGAPPRFGFVPRLPTNTITVDGEEGSVSLSEYMMPSFYHYLTIKKGTLDEARYEYVQAYTLGEGKKGEVWWTTYRHQLEAFVDKVRGRTPEVWVSPEDTVANMEALEMFYENSGLGVRPASTYQP